MKRPILLLVFFHIVCSVKHSLKYILTGTAGFPNFPEFMAAGIVDEVEMAYCDSDRKKLETRTSWMEKVIKENVYVLKWYNSKCLGNQHHFRAQIQKLKKRFNQSDDAHVFQRMNGCEWDDETGDINGFNQYSYDGKDYIVFDLKTVTWIAPTPQAVITKHEWDRDCQFWKNAITHDCINFLKLYVGYGNSSLQTTELPSVFLLQKTPSSPVSCHATGFYPHRADMFWRKDGEELHEDVEHGEILPNHNGTFQMSVDLNISSVASEDWMKYECVFRFSGVKDDIVTRLDKAVIRTNWEKPLGVTVPIITSVAVLTLIIAAVALIYIKKKCESYRRHRTTNASCVIFTAADIVSPLSSSLAS
ncbi:major histocompatibility complex class I-related gene protein-like isoform X1 [Thunnus thynnus]|uniref:major histocompatibility complex class I-related gene protein-like isoform X1 n=2 Tax=Thunnus thynnus TaxID=8237 RepID=UPI0035273D1D